MIKHLLILAAVCSALPTPPPFHTRRDGVCVTMPNGKGQWVWVRQNKMSKEFDKGSRIKYKGGKK